MASVDNFWTVVSLFALAIFLVTLMVVWNVFAGVNDLWLHNPTSTSIRDNMQQATNNFDYWFIIGFVGMHMGLLVTAFYLRSHPVMYVIGVVLLAILAVIAAPLSNAYGEFIQEDLINTASASMPVTNHMMLNLPKYEIIMGFVSLIVLFGFAKSEDLI